MLCLHSKTDKYILFLQKEDKIKDLNLRLQVKSQQGNRVASIQVEPTISDCPEPVANNIQCNNNNCDPAVGTLVNIAANPKTEAEQQPNVAVDTNSDSAIPTNSTTKSSKTSASEENYSEAYC